MRVVTINLHRTLPTGSRFGLPLVDVYGRMVQRPSFAEVKAAKAVLPEEEKVEKIKAQFKDTHQRNYKNLLPPKTKECRRKINGWKMYFCTDIVP